MGKTWVLDTETKGTGAHMVPLEKVLRKREHEPGLALVQLPRPPEATPPPEPDTDAPRQFKVVDLMTRQTLAEDVGVRETLEVLGELRSNVDVNVFVWQPRRERWRLLTLSEQRALWEMRGPRAAASPPTPAR